MLKYVKNKLIFHRKKIWLCWTSNVWQHLINGNLLCKRNRNTFYHSIFIHSECGAFWCFYIYITLSAIILKSLWSALSLNSTHCCLFHRFLFFPSLSLSLSSLSTVIHINIRWMFIHHHNSRLYAKFTNKFKSMCDIKRE